MIQSGWFWLRPDYLCGNTLLIFLSYSTHLKIILLSSPIHLEK